MNIDIRVGNIFDVPADILISTANPWFQMTGGVNLGIMVRPQGELVFEELQRHLQSLGTSYVDPGTVVCTGPGSLPVKQILHAVSIDRSYDSSVDIVSETIIKSLEHARQLDARTITLPALATGFGPLTMEDFAAALQTATDHDWSPLETLIVVLKEEIDAEIVCQKLQEPPPEQS